MIDTHEITNWRKSSRSENGGQCVELATVEDELAIRDSKGGDTGPALVLPASARMQLRGFVTA